MHGPSQLASRAARVFGLDVRSLAAFRIAIGGLLLADLGVRSADLAAMYGQEGFAPAELARSLLRSGQWSVYLLEGSTAFQAAMFVVAGLFALALVVGYRTRAATIVCWVMVVSLHARLPVVLNAGDTLLRVLLFWSMFLPLGAAWSLDARRRGSPTATRVVSVATVAFIVQLSILYWLAGLAKWNDDWLQGNALANIFGFGLYGTALGRELLAYPTLTGWMSRSVVWFELIGPCLLYLPWATARLRMFVIVTFWVFHVAIAATITLGLFSFVAMVAWLAILPAEFWERIRLRLNGNPVQPAGIPPLAPPFEGGGLSAACCLVALGLVIYWNVVNVTHARLPATVHGWIVKATHATALQQTWALFGHAPKYDCWFVYQARLQDGRSIDLLTGLPAVAYERPSLASRQFTNHRWRKLHWRLPLPTGKPYRQPVAELYCRRWNRTHGPQEQVVQLDQFCYRQLLDQGRPTDSFTRVTLARVTLGEEGGNFAEAFRELDAP